MKHTVIDFDNMLESITKDGRRHEYCIDEMQVYKNYLHYKRAYIDHPYHERIEYHLFPNENIGIYALYQKSNISFNRSDTYKYYIDMVKVQKLEGSWDAKDLYLDFIIKCDGQHLVVDVDEFRDAIKAGELDSDEISCALSGLDNILKGYYRSFAIDEFMNSLINKYCKETLIFQKNNRRYHDGT